MDREDEYYMFTRHAYGQEMSIKTKNVDMTMDEMIEFFESFLLGCGYAEETINKALSPD